MNSQKQPDGTSSRQNESENTQKMTIHVHPTTGGQFDIEMSPNETAEELRRKISRHLQTPKDRLKVLFKEQVLDTKPLKDYKIGDGSKVTLLPSVESGFSSTVQGTQQSIIQAIESLSDPQIDDFLSGRLPLTLALRVGDHMMFVQLQLEQSQVNSQNPDPKPSRSRAPTPFSQIAQPSRCISSSRLFSDMSSSAPLGTTAPLPKSPLDFSSKKSSTSRTPLCPVMTGPVTAGPAPKIPKLSAKSDTSDRNEFLESDPDRQHFRPYPTPIIPEASPYAIFDHRRESLRHYNEIASRINHHPQGGANHLHRLATACSSLDQVGAMPPSGADHVKVTPVPEHSHKSSRKRPSSLLNPNTNILHPISSQRNPYPDHIVPVLPTAAAAAALIQNALLGYHQFNGLPPLSSLLSSAYPKYQAPSRGSQEGPPSPQSESTSPTTATPAEIGLKHPITTNMLQASSSSGGKSHSGHSSRSERHHRRASTSGRVTSGSLSHHTPGLSGARVARQMQRLRRLCGSHQQCVAYSNRELATEISSIVHMARHSHHSRSEGPSQRKSHKGCRECHGRDRSSGSGSASGSSTSSSGAQTTGACIDTFTTHGPGIFSGTFSGSLHPSIQDADGKPKRDPQTILQILTDLLNATQQYQGQLGNVGLLPQLFKDHFKGEPAADKACPKADTPAARNVKSREEASTSSVGPKATPKQSVEKIHPFKPVHHTPAYQHPYLVRQTAQSPNSKMPATAQYLSSVSTIPIGNIPVAYAPRHVCSRSSSRRSSPNRDGSKPNRHHHHHGRCHHYKQANSDNIYCTSATCRRQVKHQIMTASYIRQHENDNTRSKMKQLRKTMEQQRRRRRSRRTVNKPCNRRAEMDHVKHATATIEQLAAADNSEVLDSTVAQDEVKSGKMEVQFDDIKDFEIKEVALEPPETVTV